MVRRFTLVQEMIVIGIVTMLVGWLVVPHIARVRQPPSGPAAEAAKAVAEKLFCLLWALPLVVAKACGAPRPNALPNATSEKPPHRLKSEWDAFRAEVGNIGMFGWLLIGIAVVAILGMPPLSRRA
jgi:hypothetical protein